MIFLLRVSPTHPHISVISNHKDLDKRRLSDLDDQERQEDKAESCRRGMYVSCLSHNARTLLTIPRLAIVLRQPVSLIHHLETPHEQYSPSTNPADRVSSSPTRRQQGGYGQQPQYAGQQQQGYYPPAPQVSA